MLKKALFLDRDGVINVDHGYVGSFENFEFIDGIFSLIKRFEAQGFIPVIVTNQSGIARGYYTESEFNVLMDKVQEVFSANGIGHVAVYFCPHHEQGSIAAYTKRCQCRKPLPGLLITAANELNIDISRSVMIGDSWRDIIAADNAGVKNSYYFNSSAINEKYKNALTRSHCVVQVSDLSEITVSAD